MHWYLIYTKPRLEHCALQNLDQQGYECFLPTLQVEKIRRGKVQQVEEALFPRYLFIRLGGGESDRSWGPIRSTKGVARMVTFGASPAKIDERIIQFIQESRDAESSVERLFNEGDQVELCDGPFAGLQAIYAMPDGEQRAIVLLDLLGKRSRVAVSTVSLQKAQSAHQRGGLIFLGTPN